MKAELASEGTKSSPAVVLSVLATIDAITLNEWVAIFTLFYVGLQSAFLVWKWRREYKKESDSK